MKEGIVCVKEGRKECTEFKSNFYGVQVISTSSSVYVLMYLHSFVERAAEEHPSVTVLGPVVAYRGSGGVAVSSATWLWVAFVRRSLTSTSLLSFSLPAGIQQL